MLKKFYNNFILPTAKTYLVLQGGKALGSYLLNSAGANLYKIGSKLFNSNGSQVGKSLSILGNKIGNIGYNNYNYNALLKSDKLDDAIDMLNPSIGGLGTVILSNMIKKLNFSNYNNLIKGLGIPSIMVYSNKDIFPSKEENNQDSNTSNTYEPIPLDVIQKCINEQSVKYKLNK